MRRARFAAIVLGAAVAVVACGAGTLLFRRGFAHRARGSRVTDSRSIERKRKTVEQDFAVLNLALADYAKYFAFFPMPDWVRDLPEKEFMEHVRFSGISGTTKEECLTNEHGGGTRVFLNRFGIFTDPWQSERAAGAEHPSKVLRQEGGPWPEVEGHTLDPFDNERRTYAYGRTLVGMSFLLVSSGPDGEREIDERKFAERSPHYGFEVPLKCFAYDPTNGLTSRGDIYFVH